METVQKATQKRVKMRRVKQIKQVPASKCSICMHFLLCRCSVWSITLAEKLWVVCASSPDLSFSPRWGENLSWQHSHPFSVRWVISCSTLGFSQSKPLPSSHSRCHSKPRLGETLGKKNKQTPVWGRITPSLKSFNLNPGCWILRNMITVYWQYNALRILANALQFKFFCFRISCSSKVLLIHWMVHLVPELWSPNWCCWWVRVRWGSSIHVFFILRQLYKKVSWPHPPTNTRHPFRSAFNQTDIWSALSVAKTKGWLLLSKPCNDVTFH